MSRCRQCKATGGGFSLIELLVVIGIIGILAAILFPMLAKARQSAYLTNCQSNMKQMLIATMSYTEDFNGHIPGAMYVACRWGDGQGWTERIAKYLGSKVKPTKWTHKVYQCPAARNVDYSYGIIDFEKPQSPGHDVGLVLTSLRYTSRQIIFYELRPMPAVNNINRDETGQSNDGQRDGPSYWNMPGKPNSAVADWGMLDWLVYWPGIHGGGNNFGMADGHIAYTRDWDPARLTYRDMPRK